MGSAAENFDTWFREKLENYEEAPKAVAWENIAEKLGHRRKKRVFVFMLRIAAGMLFMLTLGLGYYYFSHQGRAIPPSITDAQQQDQPVVNQPEKNSGNETAVVSEPRHRTTLSADQSHKGSGTTTISTSQASGDGSTTAISVAPQESSSGLLAAVTVPSRIRPVSGTLDYVINLPEMTIHPGPRLSIEAQETDSIIQLNLAMIEEAEEDQQKDRNWMIGGQVAPLYSYRNLSATNSDNAYSQDIKNLNNTEKGIMAYAGGIAIAFAPSKRLSVQSGVYYSKYGQEKTDIEPVADNRYAYEIAANQPASNVQITITNSTGVITNETWAGATTDPSNKTMTQKDVKPYAVIYLPETENIADAQQETANLTAFQYFEYLEVPLVLRYKVVDRKLDFSLIGGISTNFLAGNSVKISNHYNTYDDWETIEISKVNYSGSVGVGFEYPILTNLIFNLEPKFRYYLNPIYKGGDLNVYPYSVGVFAGISYVF